MDSHTVIVDPFEDGDLLQLAELSGLPFTRVRAWPFDLIPRRVVTTVPVPRGAGGAGVLGVVSIAVAPKLGEEWPDRVVTLRDGREDILAFLGGADAPGGRMVGVVGLAGGLGTTTLAACLARSLAEHPLAVALMDTDPVPGLAMRLGITEAPGKRWADLAGERGPLLPQRLELPVWRRVRVATSDARGAEGAPFAAAAHALSRVHDVLVVDLPRTALGEDLLTRCGDVVVVLAGTGAEIPVWERLGTSLPDVALHPVVRTGGDVTAGELARRLGSPVVALGSERGVAAGVQHGVQPGDRRRGAVMTAARLLTARLVG